MEILQKRLNLIRVFWWVLGISNVISWQIKDVEINRIAFSLSVISTFVLCFHVEKTLSFMKDKKLLRWPPKTIAFLSLIPALNIIVPAIVWNKAKSLLKKKL